MLKLHSINGGISRAKKGNLNLFEEEEAEIEQEVARIRGRPGILDAERNIPQRKKKRP